MIQNLKINKLQDYQNYKNLTKINIYFFIFLVLKFIFLYIYIFEYFNIYLII